MTFNIRNGLANDGENRWELRKEFTCDVIREYSPDVLGLQEPFRFQLDVFAKNLPDYEEIGVGRDGGTKGEYSAILYRKSRFDVASSGTFWLSETPEKPSAHWGNSCLRICTWARFVDKRSSRAFYVYNTHLDHQSQRAREKGIQLIMRNIAGQTNREPFLLMGDLNSGENNPVVKYLKGIVPLEQANPIPVVDTFRVLHPKELDVCTFNHFTGNAGEAKIDYILIPPYGLTQEAAIVRTKRDGRYPSDHYPVTAHVRF
jgi:endonuclease/exonuclease/phosphatase family metal-dependent hydrolase